MFFRICQTFLYLIFKMFFRFEVSGREHIPSCGPVVIAANHISLWDPPVIGGALPRMINFMAKEELFAIPVFSWLIRKFKAFPVRRESADRAAVRTALSLLEKGEVLGIFPEGTRSKTGHLGPPEPGISLIIAKSGATVIPTAVIGTDKIFKISCGIFPKIKVKFGNPIVFKKGKPDKQLLETISSQIMAEIFRLQNEE